MRTKKRIAAITATALLLSCGTFSGCTYASLSDIAPKSYGAWDGNYIYRGNVRSKTTGEDSEYLVTSLVIDGIEYWVTETTDFGYYGDEIYLCLALRSVSDQDGETEQPEAEYPETEAPETGLEGEEIAQDVLPPVEEAAELSACFVRYSPLDRSTTVLYAEAERSVDSIFALREEGIVLYGRETWVMIDHEGNVLDEDASEYDNYRYYGENQEYIVTNNGNEWFYRTWAQEEFIKFYDGALDEMRVLDKGEVKGFLIIDDIAYNGYTVGAQGVWFYELASGKTTTFLSQNEGRAFHLNGEYFITSKKKTFTYEERTAQRRYEYSVTLQVECKLYKIDWSAGGVAFEHVYDFDGNMSDKDLTWFYPKEDGKVYFTARWVRSGGGCNGDGGMQSENYRLDPDTGKLLVKNFAKPSTDVETDKYADGVECGKYIYFSGVDSYDGGFMVQAKGAYGIYRYDTETGEEIAMQFWTEYGDEMENVQAETSGEELKFRFSKQMWSAPYYSSVHYIEPDRFIVLEY